MYKHLGNTLVDFQQTIEYLGLDVDVMRMYDAFYNQAKMRDGSLREVKGTAYYQKMIDRYDVVFCQMNETIEAKLKFKNENKELFK
jgi:hypothetical protein